MKCCKQTLTTPFCPLCGRKAFANAPLAELLIQCEATAKGQHTQAKTAATLVEGDNEHMAARRRKRAAKFTRAAEKWQRWADALRAVLEKMEGGDV